MAVVQAVPLFGSEMWVVTPRVEKSLTGFHHRSVRWMADMVPRRQQDSTEVYPPIGAALVMVGIYNIRVYIAFCQNTVVRYIATCPIMDLCLTE